MDLRDSLLQSEKVWFRHSITPSFEKMKGGTIQSRPVLYGRFKNKKTKGGLFVIAAFPMCSFSRKTGHKFVAFESVLKKTSRERHKSAPYLRLKNSKRHESVKKLKVNLTKRVSNSRKPKRRSWRAKRGILLHFLTSIVAKHQNIEG